MTRLVSTLPFHKSARWSAAVETIAPRPAASLGRWARPFQRIGIPDPTLIPRLLRAAPKAEAVLVNGGERSDLLYLAIAALCPWIRAPHLIVDAHWQPGPTRIHRFLQYLPLRLGRRLIAEVQPHSPEEIEVYDTCFGIPRERVKPLPWSTSLTGYEIQARESDGEGIISGGHSYRDYRTLLDAVRNQPWTLRIGLPPSPVTEQVRSWAADQPNVSIVQDWTFAAYWQAVADCRVFAMPITPGLKRCTADQTLCNAMALGAIVVATDAMSSRIYIDHGRTGFLVPEGDAEAWRKTLAEVYALPPERAQAIREAAMHDATTRFSEDERLRETLARAQRVADEFRRQTSDTSFGSRALWIRTGLVALLAAKVSLLMLLR